MKAPWFTASVPLLVGAAICGAAQQQEPDVALRENMLLGAVLLHDAATVKSLLQQGVSPEAKNKENDRTALFLAAESGDAAIVQLLLEFGADVTARDKLHGELPVGAAARAGYPQVVRLLLARDARFADLVASNAVYQDNVGVLEAALDTGRLSAQELSFLLDDADRSGSSEVVARLRKAGVVPPKPGVAVAKSVLATYVGSYSSEEGSKQLKLFLKRGAFTPTYFVQEAKRFPTLTFELQGGRVVGAHLRESEGWTRYRRVESPEP
jgi:Ankyrin repeats (3 copies)